MRIIRDADIEDVLDRSAGVREMERGYLATAEGDVIVFPRSRNTAGSRSLAWLGAALPRLDLLGFRVYLYDDAGHDRGEQVTVLYGFGSMELKALFVGSALGNLRTGAALAAAVHLAEPDLAELTLLGSGTQAREFALSAARTWPLDRLRVWSPTPEHAESFRADIARETALDVERSHSLAAAVRDAPAVVLATSSPRPVVMPEMLRPDALVATIQGYRASQHDVDPRLYEEAETVWTDSVEQATGSGTLFERPPLRAKVEPLGRAAADGRIRDARRRRVIANTGAPWEEVLMASALLSIAETHSRGTVAELPPSSDCPRSWTTR